MRLIVLTTSYPFGDVAEAFFETELEVLADAFDVVELMPLRMRAGGPRRVPPNVRVHPPIAKSGEAFFAATSLIPSVWARALQILGAGLRRGKLSGTLLKQALYWACCEHAYKKKISFLKTTAKPESTIVYSYWAGPQSAVVPFARRHGARTAVRYHNVDHYAYHSSNRGFLPMRRELRKASELNLLISEHGLAYFTSQPWPIVGQCEVLPLGSRDFGIKRHSSAAERPLVLVSVSHMHPVKRIDRIAEVVRQLNRKRETHWHHIGGEPEDVARFRDQYVSLPNAHFLGKLSQPELVRFYEENYITALINLSTMEGISVAAMEAMSAGLPVIATEVGGMAELVVPGESGLLLHVDEPNDAIALADRILKACAPDGEVSRSRPRAFWESHYSAAHNAHLLVEAFQTAFACEVGSALAETTAKVTVDAHVASKV